MSKNIFAQKIANNSTDLFFYSRISQYKTQDAAEKAMYVHVFYLFVLAALCVNGISNIKQEKQKTDASWSLQNKSGVANILYKLVLNVIQNYIKKI